MCGFEQIHKNSFSFYTDTFIDLDILLQKHFVQITKYRAIFMNNYSYKYGIYQFLNIFMDLS